jgi:hypothetical protein
MATVCGADYDPARVLKMADSVAYRCGFVDWADGEFHELEMPWELFVSDDDEARGVGEGTA